ncbi:MAG TPA: hypothetical protein VMX18_02240 [Candidatus Bipolaricaulota bacterium]|nr:hypothetical protein [Candidatus Bipolaricaulota bacterium]
MKTKIKILIIFLVAWLAAAVFVSSQVGMQSDGNVYVRIKQLDWNTFYFEPKINNLNEANLVFEWDFSDDFSYEGRDLVRTLDNGDYLVRLKAYDFYGRQYSQVAKVNVSFWTLNNKWFWGGLYLIIMLLIVYYWLAKLIYLANEKLIREHTAAFFEALDDVHFWKSLAAAIRKS